MNNDKGETPSHESERRVWKRIERGILSGTNSKGGGKVKAKHGIRGKGGKIRVN